MPSRRVVGDNGIVPDSLMNVTQTYFRHTVVHLLIYLSIEQSVSSS